MIACAAVIRPCTHLPAILLLLAAGCAAPRSRVTQAFPGEVQVRGLALSFDEPGAGRLQFELSLEGVGEPAEAQAVDWELWLDNRYFAAGAEKVALAVPPQGEVSLPLQLQLHFPKMPVAGEPQRLKVSTRGGVVLRGGAREERHPFSATALLRVERVPVLEAPSTGD